MKKKKLGVEFNRQQSDALLYYIFAAKQSSSSIAKMLTVGNWSKWSALPLLSLSWPDVTHGNTKGQHKQHRTIGAFMKAHTHVTPMVYMSPSI